MPERNRITRLGWLAATALAVAACSVWLLGGPNAVASPWMVLPFALTGGLLIAVARYALRDSPRARYRRCHKPLAGPRPGARLGD